VPNVVVSPASETFPDQQVGSNSAPQSVKLSNQGSATLSITSISIVGTNAGDFSQSNACGSSLGAGQNCTISVTFKPTAAGARTGSISISDNAAGSPQAETLSGAGTQSTGGGGALIVPQFFAMTPGFNDKYPFGNLWPSVTIGTMAKVGGTEWSLIERTQGSYTWDSLDSAIQNAHSNGVNSIIYTISGVPPFYTPNPSACGLTGCPGPPTDMQAFDNFITALVTRYKGEITYYELWNEGNLAQSWGGTTAQLVSLGQSAYQTIKQIDPSAKVLAPSPSIASDFSTFVQSYLQGGGAGYADGIAWHAYRCQDGKPSASVCAAGTSCDNNALDCAGAPLEAQVQAIRAAAQAAGASDKPIFDTEGGWGQNQYLPNVNDQIAYISRWYIILASEGVTCAAWYQWGGDPSDATQWGTLFDSNTDSATEAASAYQVTYNWLNGATMNSACSADASNVWTCPLTFSNQEAGLIVWNGNEVSSVYAPASKYIQYEDLSGGSPTAISAGGTVNISAAPILLETANRP
jgi:polysaccharide biosynthesis protein PslG